MPTTSATALTKQRGPMPARFTRPAASASSSRAMNSFAGNGFVNDTRLTRRVTELIARVADEPARGQRADRHATWP